jgi:hypothetical protein
LICPNISAQNRRLLRTENVKKYYDDKMALLRQTGMNEKFMAAELTNGMPHHYKTTLFASQVKTTTEWLSIASQIEADFQQMTRRVEAKRTVNINYSASTSATQKQQQFTDSQKPHNKDNNKPKKRSPLPC